MGPRRSRGSTRSGSSRSPAISSGARTREPRWDRKRGSVVATERVTLFGLPIVADRTVPYGRIDPALSRELFIRRALVEGDWETRHEFFAENERLVEEVEALEDRARRRDILVDDAGAVRLLRRADPGRRRVRRALRPLVARRAPRRARTLLDLHARAAARRGRRGRVDPRGWPDDVEAGRPRAALSYRFEPGADDDGVTVHVPLRAARRSCAPDRFEWLVPGLRAGARDDAAALAAEGPAARRSCRARDRRGGAGGAAAARAAAARRVARAARARCAASASRARRGTSPRSRRTCACASGRGRRRRACSPRATTSTRCARRSRPRLRAELTRPRRGARAPRHARWDVGTLPREVALPGTGRRVARLPGAGRRGRRPSACACSRPRPRSAAAMRARHAAAARCSRSRPPPAASSTGSATRARSRSPPRRTAALARCSTTRPRPRRRADRRGGRPGVGRGRLRAPARPRRRRARRADAGGRRAGGRGARRRPRGRAPAGARCRAVALQRRRAPTSRASSARLVYPGLRHGDRRRAAAATSSATCARAARGSSACRTPSPPTATG